jgi:hypothetical protein
LPAAFDDPFANYLLLMALLQAAFLFAVVPQAPYCLAFADSCCCLSANYLLLVSLLQAAFCLLLIH